MTAAEAHTALQISRVTSTFKVLSTRRAAQSRSEHSFMVMTPTRLLPSTRRKEGLFHLVYSSSGPSVLKCPLKRSLLDYRSRARFICLQNRALDFACMS